FGDSDDATLAVVRQVQEDAVAFIGAALWRGQWVMRVSVSSAATTIAEGDTTIEAVRRAWRKVRG
uniref:hypothetical protein n=1 Tax=Escherichia coli TaxID=562 RepID=UPI001954A409